MKKMNTQRLLVLISYVTHHRNLMLLVALMFLSFGATAQINSSQEISSEVQNEIPSSELNTKKNLKKISTTSTKRTFSGEQKTPDHSSINLNASRSRSGSADHEGSMISTSPNPISNHESHQYEFVATQLQTDSNGSYFIWNTDALQNNTSELIQKLKARKSIEDVIVTENEFKIYIDPSSSEQELTSLYNRLF